ncbi:outer membrane beta-barrel protein [Pedobacter petrophilus]|uniref:Outer membrane beta-barrel protein n=1 Tax=Pedobacter petrophilus TaxID=1908241 RepID=A0A7K0FWC9_9SPHI|nr:outer membrane beta-barrel protein [Pedobacter petrophilus]MRX75289.1 outer membrane beta-barrel protein [Pedobacter petrophilus]
MKKLFTTLSFLAIFVSAFAQTKPIKFGIKAGVTFPTISANSGASAYDGPEPDYKTNTSFYLGGTVDLPVSDLFSVQPGLALIGKGAKAHVYNSNFEPGPNLYIFEGSYKVNIMYLEIPVNAVFNFNVGNGKIFFGGGPYYGFGIGGKIKYEGVTTANGRSVNESTNFDVKFGDNEDFKRGDFGFNFLAGYQLKNGFNLHAGYGLGLTTIIGGPANSHQEKNRVLSAGIGFSL